MKITILGNCGPYPSAGGACSGYLLEDGENKILIDCGNGVLSRLLEKINNLDEITAVILTHLHSDHISDAMVLRYAVGINKEKGMLNKSIPLFAPAKPTEIFESLQFKDAFVLNTIDESTVLNFGDMQISFKLMVHPVETYGVVVQKGLKKFVYSSDTKYCNAVEEIAKDADLFLCECNVMEIDKTEDTYHLSGKDVGQIANISKVKRVLITHLWPEYNFDDVLNEVKSIFDGDVEIAEEFKTYEV
ncbi:MBL fold metallo-hydrolase [Caminicella sporogenes]|uniref:MBL fold metallo-hydrolase n=1 Tax=Caminicella sporogenes TaxID=166485 RepID=UPI0025426388|nr:MBL fold metallo-hydrolase [Caminicella sporogenes]WIF94825.1 MBL fold metallo-hydrolase [Caminicella sporogenes]